MRTREPKKPDKVYQKQDEIAIKKAERADLRKKRKEAANQVAIACVIAQAKLPADTCPACQEKTMLIDEIKNRFSCKSCRKNGNVIRFSTLSLGLTDRKAISYLEQISQPQPNPSPKKPPLKKRTPTPIPTSKSVSKPICAIELERLKKEISLVDLMRESGLEFRRVGKDLFTRCPFHQDKTPSMSVSPNNLFHCFSCNVGGSTIDWVMKKEKISFLEAAKLLREKYPHLQSNGKPVKTVRVENSPKETESIKLDPARKRELLARTVDYYHQSLLKTPKALDYLARRGIDNPELIKKFQLGFADRSLGLKLPKKRSKGGEVREDMEEIGLFRPSGHEHFSGSIVIPTISPKGEITEIYGRKINDNLRTGTSKHLYLPEAHEGIFNPSCLSSEEIILCESLIDALSFWAQGFHNVTASYGTQGFTAEYFAAFGQHKPKRVCIAYDNDEGGNKAALRLAEKLIPLGIECFRVVFSTGQDANEFVCRVDSPREKLGKLLRQAVDLRSYFPLLAVKAVKKEATKEKNKGSMRGYVRKQGEELEFAREDRIYRVRGLDKNRTTDALRITLRVQCGSNLYFDSLDLYSAPRRMTFAQSVARELQVNASLVRADLTDLLLELERIQHERLSEKENSKQPQVAIPQENRAAAEVLLRDPNLIGRIAEDFKRCGLVGEEDNALILYLCMTSRLMKRPLALIIQSFSAAGKTTLMNFGLKFMPPEVVVSYTAMSGQSLFYMGQSNLKNKILAISEEKGAERATYPLKIMQSEGELCMASAGKDSKSGRFTTHEYKVEGPVAILLATTAMGIDEELANRCLFINANEENEQTQAIQDKQRSSETLEDIVKKQEIADIQKLHQDAQRLLKPLVVVNPYARYLTFPKHRVRYRRDQTKYLALIRASTLLHQRQRKTKKHTLPSGEGIEYVEANLQDIALANRLFACMFGECLDEMPPQTRKLLLLIHTMVTGRCKIEGVEQDECFFTRREVRKYSNWHNTQLKIHLDRLVDLEYILVKSGKNGQRYFYELNYHGQGQQEDLFTPGLIDTQELAQKLKLEYD